MGTKLNAFGWFSGTGEKVISTIILILISLIVLKIALALVRRMLRHSNMDQALHTFVINCIRVIGTIFIVIMALGNLDVNTSAFITVLGACGAAVALALKDSLGNFAGGILILMTKPFSKGDYVETNGVAGKVQEIDLLYSKLTTLDNKLISIPNGNLTTQVVINYTALGSRRIDCQFGIGYDCSIEQARQVILELVGESEYFLDDPAPIIGVAEHGDNAVILDVLVWCKSEDFFPARYYLYEHAKTKFDEAGIDIPYPHVIVKMSEN